MPDITQSTPPQSAPQAPLYAKRQKIHPKAVTGFYRRLKDFFLVFGLALYHLTPLLRWDRGQGQPDQAVLFDINGRRIFFFELEIWPQDIYILSGIMIVAAVGLFFLAALWGRAWCGFACFQTLWSDLFMKIEHLVEGDRASRLSLDRASYTFRKVFLRVIKHGLWAAISGFFALSFLWYFGDAFEVTRAVFRAEISGWALVTFLSLALMTYLMAGFAREQVCLYMCPYGRFQGVMFDEHSKVVTYEDWRGEDRGKIGKSRDFSNRGHCVDCQLCVQVCPSGVDIRKGNQMGCIGCGLCVDACNSIMEKFDLPKNLISYDSQVNIQHRARTKSFAKIKSQSWWRPRTLAYGAILIGTVSLTVFGFASREVTKITVLKDRSPFYVMMKSGQIQNAYTLRILNKSKEDKTYRLALEGDFRASLRIHGQDAPVIHVPKGDIITLRSFVRRSDETQGALPLTFKLVDLESLHITRTQSVFHAPS